MLPGSLLTGSTPGAESVMTRSKPSIPVSTFDSRETESSYFSRVAFSPVVAAFIRFLMSSILAIWASSEGKLVAPGGPLIASCPAAAAGAASLAAHMSDQPWRAACRRVRHSGRLSHRLRSRARSLSIWRRQSSRRSFTACSACMMLSGVHPWSSSPANSASPSFLPSGLCSSPTVCASRSSLTRISSSATSRSSALRTSSCSWSCRSFSSIACLSASSFHCALSSFILMRVSASSRPT
mmetsp:Transcript_32479/g.62395  ORF Transcript_32479/g.62395 Transcript_32479/m.62395 type:complete len:239 (-) Transcript_32479:1249-1965(-)